MMTAVLRTAAGGAALLLMLTAATSAAGAEDARERIFRLLRAGDRAAALPLARAWTESHPDDATMLYNLACLEARAGARERALAALRAALDLRIDALDGAAADPDLASLRGTAGFANLVAEQRARLALLAAERGADLRAFGAGPERDLTPTVGPSPDGGVTIRPGWNERGLTLHVRAEGAWSALGERTALLPWQGGSGVVVTLAVPDGGPAWRSGNTWLFAFGLEKTAPVGAMWVPRQQRWQRIVELDPRARAIDDGAFELDLVLPWSALMPYHPLVDAELGLNVAVRVVMPGGTIAVADLLPDPARFAVEAPARRVVPITFSPEAWPGEAFVGRLDDSVARGEPLGLELTAIAATPGPATLTVDVLDEERRSVVPGGARGGAVELAAGPNRIDQELDFSDLDTGPYLVRTTLTFPSGDDAEWSSSVLQLARDWRRERDAAIARLASYERPTGRYYLARIDTALAHHRPRRHPGAIATTLDELDAMLARAERTGTIVPREGTYRLVVPAPDGSPRVWAGYRPPAPSAARRQPVLILAAPRGLEPRYAQRLQRYFTHERPALADPTRAPDFLVPEIAWPAARSIGPALPEARAALAWVRERRGGGAVDLAGVGAGAEAALRLAAERPGAVARLAIMAGGQLEPWPQADDTFVAARLQGLDRALPVAWYDFDDETRQLGQAKQIRAALDALGLTSVADRPVRGALSLTQAADRIALWSLEETAPMR